MQHCTPEQLALAALREPLPDADSEHLVTCDACRAEMTSLQRAVDALAVPQLAAPVASVAPPPSVWAAIAAGTGATATPRPEVVAAFATRPPAPLAPSVAASAPEPPSATVLPFRRRRGPLLMVAAATVAGVAIGAGTVAALQGDDADPETAPVAAPVAEVGLDPLADNVASGRASVVEAPDGSRTLQVELRADNLDDRYYEVWLIDEAVEDMVPVGVARAGTVSFQLPDDLDLARFPIVDVSVEPLDGDPTHSGVSIVRGVLET